MRGVALIRWGLMVGHHFAVVGSPCIRLVSDGWLLAPPPTEMSRESHGHTSKRYCSYLHFLHSVRHKCYLLSIRQNGVTCWEKAPNRRATFLSIDLLSERKGFQPVRRTPSRLAVGDEGFRNNQSPGLITTAVKYVSILEFAVQPPGCGGTVKKARFVAQNSEFQS